uniref:hypothetical protein n=1 Tax=Salmonella enterica TaxID=28901 RepID=UPI001F39A611|nr:hypothetical protein [Salmonella enterica]
MGSCAAPSAKGDDKFITTDYLQQCPQNNLPVLIGNCLHINTGSLYMSKLEDQVIVAPGIPPTDSPALTLVEIIMKNNPVLLCHQLIQTTNKFYSLKTYPLELDSIENNIEVTR